MLLKSETSGVTSEKKKDNSFLQAEEGYRTLFMERVEGRWGSWRAVLVSGILTDSWHRGCPGEEFLCKWCEDDWRVTLSLPRTLPEHRHIYSSICPCVLAWFPWHTPRRMNLFQCAQQLVFQKNSLNNILKVKRPCTIIFSWHLVLFIFMDLFCFLSS